jgi:hypothetical protein
MLGNFQKYEVNVTFTIEREVFPEDPNDVYELSELEKPSILNGLEFAFPDAEISEFSVTPVIGD